MVSGFFTSPCDQVLMWSAVASPILSWSNMLTSSMCRSPHCVPRPRRPLVTAPSAGAPVARIGRRVKIHRWLLCDRSERAAGPPGLALAVVLVGAALGAGNVDAEFLGGPEHVLVEV